MNGDQAGPADGASVEPATADGATHPEAGPGRSLSDLKVMGFPVTKALPFVLGFGLGVALALRTMRKMPMPVPQYRAPVADPHQAQPVVGATAAQPQPCAGCAERNAIINGLAGELHHAREGVPVTDESGPGGLFEGVPAGPTDDPAATNGVSVIAGAAPPIHDVPGE